MKMKRISTILLALLMLISFTACNLDNNGILYRGPNRTPSDNKNRNYIGYVTSTTEPTTHSIYFLTSDGLSRSIYNSESGSFSADQVLSSDDIFNTIYQSFGLIQNDSIVYLEDTRNNQAFHLVKVGDNGNVTISDLPTNITGASGSTDSLLSDPIYLYRYYDGSVPYIVGKTSDDSMAAVYSVTGISDNSTTLNLTQIFSVSNYIGSENGLLWYEETVDGKSVTKFKYANSKFNVGKEITFWHDVTDEENNETTPEMVTVNPETIQSVLQHDDTPTFFVPTTGSTKLIFLDYNISDSSVLYCVNLSKLGSDPDNATTQTSLSSGIEAEAFIQFESQESSGESTNIVYMMTKNHGFYRIDVSSDTPSVRKI